MEPVALPLLTDFVYSRILGLHLNLFRFSRQEGYIEYARATGVPVSQAVGGEREMMRRRAAACDPVREAHDELASQARSNSHLKEFARELS